MPIPSKLERFVSFASTVPQPILDMTALLKLEGTNQPLFKWTNVFFEATYTAKLFTKRAPDIMRYDMWNARVEYLKEKYGVEEDDLIVKHEGGGAKVRLLRYLATFS